MNAPATPRLVAPAIGSQHAGGTVLGHVFIASEPYALIVPAKAAREHPGIAWSKSVKHVPDAVSILDGLANTKAMAAAGCDLGQWAAEQSIEGYDDWYIGARSEMLIIRGNAPLAGAAYQPGGREAFRTDTWYYTSTQSEFYGAYAWVQSFGGGNQATYRKSDEYAAFVVRRELIR